LIVSLFCLLSFCILYFSVWTFLYRFPFVICFPFQSLSFLALFKLSQILSLFSKFSSTIFYFLLLPCISIVTTIFILAVLLRFYGSMSFHVIYSLYCSYGCLSLWLNRPFSLAALYILYIFDIFSLHFELKGRCLDVLFILAFFSFRSYCLPSLNLLCNIIFLFWNFVLF
jgi:hypothetical protein